MAKQVQLRRGTTAEHSTFTGAVGEVTVDTTKDVVVVHDGVTAGGTPMLKISDITGGTGITVTSGQVSVNPAVVTTLTGTQTLTNKTLNGAVLNDGYTEGVFAVTGTTPALSPANGSIQTWTLTGNSTPTAGTWNAGQSITLMVDDGTAFTITWTSVAVTWVNNAGAAPTLATSGFTTIALWKVGSTIYGALVGNGT